jgi:hypothetical protein
MMAAGSVMPEHVTARLLRRGLWDAGWNVAEIAWCYVKNSFYLITGSGTSRGFRWRKRFVAVMVARIKASRR